MPTFLKGAAGSLIRCVAFAPDRPVCATGGASGEVAVHDVLKPTRQVVTSTAAITSLAWETGSTCLAAGRADGRVDVYADG
jgi:WD40 repeat protein